MRKYWASHPEYRQKHTEHAAKIYKTDPDQREVLRARAREWARAHKEKVSASKRAYYLRTRKLKGPNRPKGSEHYHWKGEEVKYQGLHQWVRKVRGTPTVCEHCGKEGKRLNWANVDHKYRRVAEDYIRLCESCHYKYDVEHGLRPKFDVERMHAAAKRKRDELSGR